MSVHWQELKKYSQKKLTKEDLFEVMTSPITSLSIQSSPITDEEV